MSLANFVSRVFNRAYRCFGSFEELPKHCGTRVFVAADKKTREQFGNALAFCFGNEIYVKNRRLWTVRIKRHEMVHIRQFKRMGLYFPLAYAWEYCLNGYWENVFEKEARRGERIKKKR